MTAPRILHYRGHRYVRANAPMKDVAGYWSQLHDWTQRLLRLAQNDATEQGLREALRWSDEGYKAALAGDYKRSVAAILGWDKVFIGRSGTAHLGRRGEMPWRDVLRDGDPLLPTTPWFLFHHLLAKALERHYPKLPVAAPLFNLPATAALKTAALYAVKIARRKAAMYPTVDEINRVSEAEARQFLVKWEQKLLRKGFQLRSGYHSVTQVPLEPGDVRFYDDAHGASYRLLLDFAYTGPGTLPGLR